MIELLEDVGGTLSIADMADPAIQQRFTANGRASVGQNPNPWWIAAQRGAEAPARWWLEIGAVTQLDLQLYSPDGQGGWIQRQVRRTGQLRRRARPPLSAHGPGAAGAGHDIHHLLPAQLRFSRQLLPLRVWQLEDLDHQAISETWAWA